MTALVMQRLAEALAKEGFIIKKIEDEEHSSFSRPNNGEKYTGEIILKIRPADEEEAEAEMAKLRKAKERGDDKPDGGPAF